MKTGYSSCVAALGARVSEGSFMRWIRSRTFVLGQGTRRQYRCRYLPGCLPWQSRSPLNHLTVIEPIGDYPESQGLGFCNCSLAGFAVTHDSRQIENVCEPPAVVFLFNFYPHGPAPQIAGLRIGFPPQPSLASLDLWKVDSWVTTPNPRLVATAGRQSFIRTSNRKREPPGFRGQDASGYLRRRATAARPRPPTARA